MVLTWCFATFTCAVTFTAGREDSTRSSPPSETFAFHHRATDINAAHPVQDTPMRLMHCGGNERRIFILQNLEIERCEIVLRFPSKNKLMTSVIWEPSTCSGGQLKTEAVRFLRVITARRPEISVYLFPFCSPYLCCWSFYLLRPPR